MQHAITGRLPGYHDGVTQAAALAAAHPATALPALASALGVTLWLAAGLTALALLLPGRGPHPENQTHTDSAEESMQQTNTPGGTR